MQQVRRHRRRRRDGERQGERAAERKRKKKIGMSAAETRYRSVLLMISPSVIAEIGLDWPENGTGERKEKKS
jgi:hypothetical protein